MEGNDEDDDEDDDEEDEDDDEDEEEDEDQDDENQRVAKQVSMSMIDLSLSSSNASGLPSRAATTTSSSSSTTNNTSSSTTTNNTTAAISNVPSALWNMRTHSKDNENASGQEVPRGLDSTSSNESRNVPGNVADGDVALAGMHSDGGDSEVDDVLLYGETRSELLSGLPSSKQHQQPLRGTATSKNVMCDTDDISLSSSPFSPSSPSSSPSPTTPPPSSTKSSSLLDFLQVNNTLPNDTLSHHPSMTLVPVGKQAFS